MEYDKEVIRTFFIKANENLVEIKNAIIEETQATKVTGQEFKESFKVNLILIISMKKIN